jgi:uncharacterized protein (TIGR02284 family)
LLPENEINPMFIRDDGEAELSELAERCAEVADHYAISATRLRDRRLAEMFADLAQQHGELAAELAEQLRGMGSLPRAPDPDREAAAELLSAMKEVFTGDAASSVLNDQIQREKKLADAAEATLGNPMPEPARASVLKVAQTARAVQEQLSAVRA